jgi:hypothetical protein
MTTTINKHLDELRFLIDGPYGRNHIEREFGTQLAEDVAPFFDGDFSSLTYIENKYKFLDALHTLKQRQYSKTPLEVRRLKEETSSYMVDKMCYFTQVHNCIKNIQKIKNSGV